MQELQIFKNDFLEVQCKKRLYIYISENTGGERNET